MAGSDVRSGHIRSSGFVSLGRTRIKAYNVTGTSGTGTVDVFDTDVAPTQATYGRSGTTITVTSTGHGLLPGHLVGISFQPLSSVAATNGNYTVQTVADANTFTITDINSGTINTGTDCHYVNGDSRWVLTKDLTASDIYANVFTVPDAGHLIRKAIYVRMVNMLSVNVVFD